MRGQHINKEPVDPIPEQLKKMFHIVQGHGREGKGKEEGGCGSTGDSERGGEVHVEEVDTKILAPDACLVDVLEAGCWVPPYREGKQFRRPIYIAVLEGTMSTIFCEDRPRNEIPDKRESGDSGPGGDAGRALHEPLEVPSANPSLQTESGAHEEGESSHMAHSPARLPEIAVLKVTQGGVIELHEQVALTKHSVARSPE